MAAPELFPAAPLLVRPGRPTGRVVIDVSPSDPAAPAFFEWRLDGEEWSDEHPHDEYVFVLDGELHVRVDDTTVVAVAGSVVRVPAGSRGSYAAPVHARLLSVYGPRPSSLSDPRGVLRKLPGA